MSDNGDWLVPVLLISALCDQRQPRIASNRVYSGQDYVDDLLNCGIRNQLRMQLETFNLLRDWLLENTALGDSCHVSFEEKLFIFIYIASSGFQTVIVKSGSIGVLQ